MKSILLVKDNGDSKSSLCTRVISLTVYSNSVHSIAQYVISIQTATVKSTKVPLASYTLILVYKITFEDCLILSDAMDAVYVD